jgi:hypothetical protein
MLDEIIGEFLGGCLRGLLGIVSFCVQAMVEWISETCVLFLTESLFRWLGSSIESFLQGTGKPKNLEDSDRQEQEPTQPKEKVVQIKKHSPQDT